MKWVSVITLAILHNALCAHFNVRIDPLVYLEQGLVRGERASDGDYAQFLGVPYAQVNPENPFGPAEPAPHFDEIYNAFDGSIKCAQMTLSGTVEGVADCLRLNIYVPKEASSKNLLPVLTWIHGGSFEFGSAGELDPKYLVEKGIIVVTINYRLSAYGFLCVDSSSIPCNQGLKDQYAAITWVRNNIAAFGGNPYDMTLGGDSAGSAATLFQLYTTNERYFNKIIAQSGTPLTETLFVEKDLAAANKIAAHLGFEIDNTEEALEFLKKVDPHLVVAAVRDLKLSLRPCKENVGSEAIVTSNPFSFSNPKIIKNTPILIGHTSKELLGLEMLLQMIDGDFFKSDPFYRKIKNNFKLDEVELEKAVKTIRHFYIGDKSIGEDVVPALENFESDFLFNHPVQMTVSKLIEENPAAVYQYVFNYSDTGATSAEHSSEMKYLFRKSHFPKNYLDQQMIDRMSTLWSNFVKYGNPTPETNDLIPVTWEPASADSRPFMVLDTDLKTENRVFHERMAFWDLFYDEYGQYHVFADNE